MDFARAVNATTTALAMLLLVPATATRWGLGEAIFTSFACARRGLRVTDYLQSECTAIAVAKYGEDAGERAEVERHLNFARNMRIAAVTIESKDPAQAVADYARQKRITQIFVTRQAPDLHKLVRLVRDMQVTIVAERVRQAR